MQECANLVKKINQDKKERELKMQDIQRRNEEKLNADLEERMRIIELKAQRDEQEKERRRQQVEQRINERM